ncbi:zinc ABC transporter substrate-binding protein, partial [Geobacillus sp. G4]
AKSEGINVTLGGELYSDAMGEEGTEEGTYIGMYRHNINTIYEALSEGGK